MPIGSTPAHPLIVGRDPELQLLGTVLDRVRFGVLAACFVEGEAGIGKTRLLDELQAEAVATGFQVLHAAAQEYERTRPFALASELLALRGASDADADRSRRAIVDALAAMGGEARSQFTVVDLIVELVEAAATQHPVAILADDLQWADPPSIAVLEAVLRRLGGLPIALIGARRPSPLSSELAHLVEAARRSGGQQVLLAPLGDEHVVDLVQRLVGGEPSEALRRRVSTCHGNPFLLRELLAALDAEGALRVADERADVLDGELPTTLRQTILHRVAALPTPSAEVLRLASVLGTHFSANELATAAGRNIIELTRELQPILEAELLVDDEGRLAFRHDLVREALYESQPEALRKALHREIGAALERFGADPVSVAQHFWLSAEGPDADAARRLRRAARHAGRTAPGTAAELLERSLHLLHLQAEGRDEIVAELCEQLVWAGRAAEVEPLAVGLVQEAGDRVIRQRAVIALLRTLWLQGRWAELVTVADTARQDSEDEAFVGRMLAEAAIGCLFLGDPGQRAERDARAALEIGERLADDAVTFLAAFALAPIYDFRGPFDDGVEYAERSSRIARRTGDPDLLRYHPDFGLGMVLLNVDRHEDAERSLHRGMRTGELLGTSWDLPLYHTGLAVHGYVTGRWDAAVAEAEAAVRLGEEVGTEMANVAAHAIMSLIAYHRGELAAADRFLTTAEDRIDRYGRQWGIHWAVAARALLQDASGDRIGCVRTLERFVRESAGDISALLWCAAHTVRAATSADERAVAASVTARIEAAESLNCARQQAVALHCRGLLDADPAALTDAVDRYRSTGRPLDLALAAVDAAELQGAAGAREVAVELLEEASSLFQGLGAQRELGRVEAVLRSLGVRRGRRGPRQRPSLGWESLTPTEEQVVALVSEGLTNAQIGARLFISPRTVEAHLTHVFAKLSLSSRVELAAEVVRRREPLPAG